MDCNDIKEDGTICKGTGLNYHECNLMPGHESIKHWCKFCNKHWDKR